MPLSQIDSDSLSSPIEVNGNATTATTATTAGNVTGTVAIANGGTGSSTAGGALTNLGAQATLVSGISIKTINSASLLGSGDIPLSASPGGSNTQIQYNSSGAFTGSANLVFDGTNFTCGGNVTAYSDERIKTDWSAPDADFVDRLALVKSGTYTRTDSGQRQAGASAQDWLELLPEVVHENTDGQKTLSLAYGNAAVVACIQLAQRVLALEAVVAKLTKGD